MLQINRFTFFFNKLYNKIFVIFYLQPDNLDTKLNNLLYNIDKNNILKNNNDNDNNSYIYIELNDLNNQKKNVCNS